jgi:hypothetical protein
MVVFYFDAKWRGTKEIVVLSFRVFWKKVAAYYEPLQS